LGWTNADVLKFAIAAAVGGGSICGFVIWQLGDYTSRPRGEDEDFVEADRATRLRVLGLVIAPILLLLLARVAFKNAADQLLIMLPAWAAAWFGASICLLWVGIRVKRSGRWPPPGMRMAARTRIRRGKYAMWSRIVRVSAAGGLPTSWLVCYEHGGRGYVRHLVIFGVRDDRVELQFSGSVGAKVTSLRELRKAIREGHVSDNTRDASGHY